MSESFRRWNIQRLKVRNLQSLDGSELHLGVGDVVEGVDQCLVCQFGEDLVSLC